MRTLLLLALFALSNVALATGNHNNEGGCRGNCEQTQGGPSQGQTQGQVQGQDQDQKQSQGQSQSADATAVAGAIAGANASADNHNSVGVGVSSRNDVDVNTSDYNKNDNTNLNVANGGAGGAGGEGGSASQGQSQLSVNDNSNSSNNSSSQSTSLTFESTGEAEHYNKYGSNVSAIAPNVYASGTCLGGVSAGAAGMGFGVSVGGTKKDEECSVRENARILASLNPDLSLIYLCANPLVDIGAVLGAACKPAVKPEPPVVLPPDTEPEVPVEIITDDVKGK